MAEFELLGLPRIPAGLREVAARGILVPFIGAGASRLAGCPDWNGFADACLRVFVEAGEFSHSELELVKNLNPKVKLAVALSLQEGTEHKIDFETILHPKDWQRNSSGRQLYGALSKLAQVFVTTNYDRWLDMDLRADSAEAIPAEVGLGMPSLNRIPVYRPSEFGLRCLSQPGTIVHLHGSLEAPASMTLTMRHYLELYANDRQLGPDGNENLTLTLLEDLFRHYSVLFVGYGLEELEILEYVIQKSRVQRAGKGEAPRHFMLQGYYSHQSTLARRLETYYRDEYGVQLIPFALDIRGHAQLIDVLEEFARELPASSTLFLEKEQQMKALLIEALEGVT